MAGSGGGVVAAGDDQFTAAQRCKGDLDCAFGKPGRVGESSDTRADGFPFLPHRLAVKVQVNQICSGLLIVPDQIAHQDVENVVVDGNGLFEARHGRSER